MKSGRHQSPGAIRLNPLSVVGVLYLAVSCAGATNTVSSQFSPTTPNLDIPPQPTPSGMVWIPGGEFSMGSEDPRESFCGGPDAMQDARPIHRVYVDAFWMDQTEVTNEQFAKFVKASGYVT